MIPDLIRTARLVLRPPKIEDAQAIFERWAQDPDVLRLIPPAPAATVQSVEEFVRRCIAEWPRRRTWTITTHESDLPIGNLGLRTDAGHMADLGYTLMRSEWGQGLMTEAVSAVVEIALREPDIFRVWATCDVENPPSARVLEKAGMSREGLLRRWVMHPNVSPEPRDCYVYAKVR